MAVHLAVAGDVYDGCLFVLSFFLRDILGELLDLLESVSEGFTTYSCLSLETKWFSWYFYTY